MEFTDAENISAPLTPEKLLEIREGDGSWRFKGGKMGMMKMQKHVADKLIELDKNLAKIRIESTLGKEPAPMVEYTAQHIKPSKGLALKFQGRLLARVDDNQRGDKSQWMENEVWETPGGAWIAVLKGHNAGKATFVKVAVIEPETPFGGKVIEAMDTLEWTMLARRLAKELGWDLVREVG